MSYLIGYTYAYYEEAGMGDLMIDAVFSTATVFVVMTIFTLQSKWDFSFLGAGLCICLLIFIPWTLFDMIFGFQIGFGYAFFELILSICFGIYETYTLAECRDPEDCTVAPIQL